VSGRVIARNLTLKEDSRMTQMPFFETERITTLQEARNAMTRERGSFEEWLECSQVFSKTKNWEELEIAAKRALEAAGKRPIKAPLLKEAAMRFAAGSLKNFASKNQFEESCNKTVLTLREYARLFPDAKNEMKTYLDSVIETMDEILILLTDGSPAALVGIASRIRKKIGRPDLAIQIATVALSVEPNLIPAHTTRGSAYVEMEQFSSALSDFLIAEGDKESRSYAIAGHTKMLICQAYFVDALDLGAELLKLPRTKPILYLLAAAAKGANDNQKFDWLVSEAEKLPDVRSGSGRKLLMRQSIELLISQNQFDVAKALLEELLTFDKGKKSMALQELLIHAEALHLSIVNPLSAS
jgi:tetratricopeptide (TPR) repeat protein